MQKEERNKKRGTIFENEKHMKTKKVKCEIFEDLQGVWLHTHNPRRFPGFVVVVVVVVVFFRRNPRRFPCFFGMCLLPEENQQPILVVSPFFKGKMTISTGRETKRTSNQRKTTKYFLCKISPKNNYFSSRIFNHSTTTTTTSTTHNTTHTRPHLCVLKVFISIDQIELK